VLSYCPGQGQLAGIGRRGTIMDILLVQDDHVVGKAVSKALTEAGHACEWAKNGEFGLGCVLSQRNDLILLDLLLPGLSGIEILDIVRQEGIPTPIIVLTAKRALEDRVNGLRLGADDYVVKPFDMAELLARIEAVLRRSITRPIQLLQTGELSLDLRSRRVTHSGDKVDLTPTEFSILEILMRYTGEVVTRKMFFEFIWEPAWEGTTNVVEVHINRLRSCFASVETGKTLRSG
jgi:two-component system OmpR family response regulator/two-component system copper resistance phosphate regulon response regulator CusR